MLPMQCCQMGPFMDLGFIKTFLEPERYGNSVYFPITNKYLLFVNNDVSSNTILEYA